jgi:hypothetical protein
MGLQSSSIKCLTHNLAKDALGTVKLTEPGRDFPQNDRSPPSLNRHRSPPSYRKEPGLGGVDGELL